MTADMLGGGGPTAGPTGVRHGVVRRHREHPARHEDLPRPRPRARRHHRARRWSSPTSAHAAFDKAAQYFGIEIVHDARRRRTGGPTWPPWRPPSTTEHGRDRRLRAVLPARRDRPDRGAQRAARRARGIGFHTDACLGGFVLPWAEKLGYDVPPFDFRRAGRDVDVGRHPQVRLRRQGHLGRALPRRRSCATTSTSRPTDWPGGLYFSPTFAGSRPGALERGLLGRPGVHRASRATSTPRPRILGRGRSRCKAGVAGIRRA